MPLPKPGKKETEKEWNSRCMGDDVMNKEYPEADQRRAVCQSQWDNKGKKKGAYSNIVSALYGRVWAILPEKLYAILDFIDLKAAGVHIDATEHIEAAQKRQASKYKNIKGQIAIMPLFGMISQRMNMLTAFSGGTSTDLFGAEFDEAINSSDIGAIVLNIDSPGGDIYGVHELAEKIYNARGKKPIVASVNSLAASAAYWIASAADEIVVTPSGELGSIGILAIHEDMSEAAQKAGIKHTIVKAGKHKIEGNEFEPLSEEALTTIQGRVDDYYDMMTADIARYRGVTQSQVKSGFGEGRVVGAKQGVEVGLADRVATFEAVTKRLVATQKDKEARRAMSDRLNKK